MQRTIHPTFKVSDDEIRRFARRIKSKLSYSVPLVRDIANLISGGQIRSPFDMEQDVKDYVRKNITPNLIQGQTKGQFYKADAVKTSNLEEANESYYQMYKEANQKMIDLLLSMQETFKKLPGRTPIEKAFVAIKMMNASNMLEQSQHENSGGSSSSSTGGATEHEMTMPKDRAGEGVDKVKDKLENYKKITPEGKELLDSALDKKDGDGDTDPDWSRLMALHSEGDYDLMMQAASKITQMESLTTQKSVSYTKDPTGDVRRSRPIRDMSEFKYLVKREFGSPRDVIISRIFNNSAIVSHRYRQQDSMPIVAMVMDESGSMTTNHKHKKALGILHNMLERVMRGETWLLFSFFARKATKYHLFKAGDKKKVLEFYRKFTKHSFDEGGTEVGKVIVQTLQELEGLYKEYPDVNFSDAHRHIIVVNDGEDDASNITLDMLGKAHLHAFILDSSNDDLKRIARQSGGIYRDSL